MKNPWRRYRNGPRVVRQPRAADLAEERLRHGHASTAEHLKRVLPCLRAKWGSQPPLRISCDELFEQRNALALWAV
jgi:hypothetical protein